MLKVRSGRPDIVVDLPDGASITFRASRPTPGVIAGRRAYASVISGGGDDAEAAAAFTIGLATWGAISWEGIGDEAGEPLALTPENLDLLLSEEPEAYSRIDRKFVTPILEREAEKNGSAPSPAGGTPVAGALNPTTTSLEPTSASGGAAETSA